MMKRQSLVKFDAPLCETIAETPKPQGKASAGADRALRAVPFRFAYPGRLRRPRRRQAARHHPRHDACRSRWDTRSPGVVEEVRPRCPGRPDRCQESRVPLDRLRSMPRLSPMATRICALKQRFLGVSIDGGFATHVLVPDAKYLLDYGSAPGQPGGDPDVFRRHSLWRAEAACRPAAATQSAADRARRRRHDGAWLLHRRCSSRRSRWRISVRCGARGGA